MWSLRSLCPHPSPPSLCLPLILCSNQNMAKIELVTQMNFLGPMFQDEVMGTISHITCCLVIGFQVASDHCVQAQAFFHYLRGGKKEVWLMAMISYSMFSTLLVILVPMILMSNDFFFLSFSSVCFGDVSRAPPCRVPCLVFTCLVFTAVPMSFLLGTGYSLDTDVQSSQRGHACLH